MDHRRRRGYWCWIRVIHLSDPRFIAKFREGDEGEGAPPCQGASVGIGGTLFYDILWCGHPPGESGMMALFQAAEAAIGRDSLKDESYRFAAATLGRVRNGEEPVHSVADVGKEFGLDG